MIMQMCEFIKFLGMGIIILIMMGIIFAIIDVIYENIKISNAKKELIKALNKELNKEDCKIEIQKLDNSNKKDV